MMLKTLKPSEVDILFAQDFLENYFKYMMENPDSLLSKIFGVFEVTVSSNPPMFFLITENMIGDEFACINRCFDLKGSLHNRLTKLTDDQKKNGSGLKTLKDQNFMEGGESQIKLK